VTNQLRAVFRTPELIARTFREARELDAEELERLRDEEQEESQRFEAARAKAERLVDSDANAVAEELGLTDTDLQQARERLAELRRQIRVIETQSLTEQEVVEALQQVDPVWDELFPAERNRIVQLLVERVEVREDGLEVRLRGDGFRSLVAELGGDAQEAQAG